MNQLSGKFVNVVLAIEEGRGMEFLKYPVNIVANFNGRVLESDKVESAETAPFNTELVWEIEKKELKKIRTANQPLRVECITNDSMQRRERVGFCLLSLRSAMIVPIKNVKMPVPFHWQKLIGCQFDKRSYHPELYVSLTIRDHMLPSGAEVETTDLSTDLMPYISEEENDSGDELVDKSFPVNYLEDGYVQIGPPKEAVQPFSFNIMVARTLNMDLLLPEVLVFRQHKDRYFMSFKIFGITIRTKPFNRELHEDIYLNEKIVIRLLSSLEILRRFFSVQPITINFICGRDKLGMATITLDNLFSQKTTGMLQMPLKMQDSYYFKYPSPNGIVPKDDKLRSPYIEVEITLRESCDVPNFLGCSGDQSNGDYVIDRLIVSNRKSKSEHNVQEMLSFPDTTKSMESFVKNLPLQQQPTKLNIQCNLDCNQKYLQEISIKSIVWREILGVNKFIFKFFHPTASTYITIFMEIDNTVNEEIPIPNLQIKMPYISSISHIRALTKMWRPKLVIMNEEEEALSKEMVFNSDEDCVLDVQGLGGEVLASITVGFCLMEFDIDFIEESDLILNPPVLDEIIFIKELGDLERWKREEMGAFKEGLERKLEREWEEKKGDLQAQLEEQMKKCRGLQEELQAKIQMVKLDKLLTKKLNSSTIFEDIFQENWKKYCEGDIREVVEELSRQQKENAVLREVLQENQGKLLQMEKTALTKEETSGLLRELKGLEEKFEEAQRAKQYFKEQWQSACNEIHELRTEDYKEMQTQIEVNRKTLSQMSL